MESYGTMSKDPSPRQVRECMKRIIYHERHLSAALHDAHNKGVIEYDNGNYKDEGPCYSLSQVSERVRKTTDKALARAMRREISDQVKWPK